MIQFKFGPVTITFGKKPVPEPPPQRRFERGWVVTRPALDEVRKIASTYGWREVWHRPDENRVRFKQGADLIVDVWYTKMTVGTILTHPKKGRNQLFRKNVSHDMLRAIFINPRSHTGEGYR